MGALLLLLSPPARGTIGGRALDLMTPDSDGQTDRQAEPPDACSH